MRLTHKLFVIALVLSIPLIGLARADATSTRDRVDRYYLYRGDSRVVEMKFRQCGNMQEDDLPSPKLVSYYGSKTLGYTAVFRCRQH